MLPNGKKNYLIENNAVLINVTDEKKGQQNLKKKIENRKFFN